MPANNRRKKMKAIFKLTPAQIKKALVMMAEVAECLRYEKEHYSGYPQSFDCGVYWLEDLQYTNPNQSVRLVGKTLIVEGERCALAYDGGINAAIDILGTADAVPVSYETSDKRLAWHETLSGYLYTRGSDAERIDYHAQRAWSLESRDALALALVLENPRLAYAKLDKAYIAALLQYKKANVLEEYAR